jgi:hypothetical protein
MVPNGGGPALEAFLRSAQVAAALRDAPPDIREKVEFLLLVAKRDLDRIRAEGARLLAGPLQTADPAFHAYVFVATSAACFATSPDASCLAVIARLDQVRRESPVIDLLRAQQAALR